MTASEPFEGEEPTVELTVDGEIYVSGERVFETEDGLIFLPKVQGEQISVTPGTEYELAMRKHLLASCMNAIEQMEPYRRDNGRWAIFADLKEDQDLWTDVVGVGESFEEAIDDLFESVQAMAPEQCVCLHPSVLNQD